VKATIKPLFAGLPAFYTDPANELVKTAERLTGNSAASVAFGTEAPLLQRLGMDTIILGPGDIDQAHKPDEFVALEQIALCEQFLRRMIERLEVRT
jgi:acetylornithine deacetylase